MSIKTPTIFVVDKNPLHRNLIKYNLDIRKFANVQTFQSGEECLYRLHRTPNPDFLITSFFTGTHNGFEFLHSVLEISTLIQVIFFDTFEDPHIAEKLLKAGACDYVLKTRNPEGGISDLLKNLHYISREKAFTNVY